MEGEGEEGREVGKEEEEEEEEGGKKGGLLFCMYPIPKTADALAITPKKKPFEILFVSVLKKRLLCSPPQPNITRKTPHRRGFFLVGRHFSHSVLFSGLATRLVTPPWEGVVLFVPALRVLAGVAAGHHLPPGSLLADGAVEPHGLCTVCTM